MLFKSYFLWAPSALKKFILKPQPEPMAWAFQNLRPGQSHGQAVTWARLGPAHGLKSSRAHHYIRSMPFFETLNFPFWELNLLIYSSPNLMYEVNKCHSMFYFIFQTLG